MSRILLLLAVMAALVACERREPETVVTPAVEAPKPEPLTVLVAASAKDVMQAVIDDYAHAIGLEVRLVPGPSNQLANQIIAGAPADLFLSANRQWMQEIEDRGLVVRHTPLLGNSLVLIVPHTNRAEVREPADLLSERVKRVGLAGEYVPAGRYAQQALNKLGLFDTLVDSGRVVRGQDVRDTLAFTERGEVDAAVVYATDAAVAPSVVVVHRFDPALHDAVEYPLGLLVRGRDNPQAVALYEHLLGDKAAAVYRDQGFTRLP